MRTFFNFHITPLFLCMPDDWRSSESFVCLYALVLDSDMSLWAFVVLLIGILLRYSWCLSVSSLKR